MKKISKLLIFIMTVSATSVFAEPDKTSLSDKTSPVENSQTKPTAEKEHPYTYKTPKLNRARFDILLAKPEQILLIDVRRPDELTKNGGFPVYLSIQLQDLEKSLAYIPKDRSIITVSNHAGRAGKSADLLAEKGFKVVGAVGAQNYEAEGGVLTKIKPEDPKKPAGSQPSATTTTEATTQKPPAENIH